MEYIKVDITCKEDFAEVFIAELSELGFEAFEEHQTGVRAYVPDHTISRSEIDEVLLKYHQAAQLEYTYSTVAKENWNQVWEDSFSPVDIDGQVYIRADFHEPKEGYAYPITITPKMSFGTGHHATTHQMVSHLLNIPMEGKRVADLGSGTGVLAILAKKMGASYVAACDIEDWAVENARENFDRNEVDGIALVQGTVKDIPAEEPYDLVLANINKNTLLREMPRYVELLASHGLLLLSGFFTEDNEELEAAGHQLGLETAAFEHYRGWASLLLKKPS